jgi:CHAD domain-containing protein
MNVTKRDKLALPSRKKDKIKLSAKKEVYLPVHSYLFAEFNHARKHESGLLRDDDSEFLHQYRVSLRRCRAITTLMKGIFQPEHSKALTNNLKILMQKTNQLRDLDVYLLKMDDYFDCLEHKHHQGLARFFDDLQNHRRKSFKEVKLWIKTDDYQQQCLEIKEVIEQLRQNPLDEGKEPSLIYGKEMIDNRYHKVLVICQALTLNSSDDDIHHLRIECKKLRYLLAYFSPLFSNEIITKQISTLKVLQDSLGLFNDSSVQQIFLADYLTARKPTSHRYLAVDQLLTITKKEHLVTKQNIIKQLSQFTDSTNIESYDALYALPPTSNE